MDESYSVIVNNLSKAYRIYDRPGDRVREALHLSRRTLHTDFCAVSDVSFALRRGEVLGIMGRNGSGKSTLLKMITGLLTPSAGTVSVCGRISSLIELGAGFNLEYSGLENIGFYSTLMGLTAEQIKTRTPDIIAFAEIGDYIHQPVKTYSSGMFARLAFSCAIHVDPDVLVVDEILSVGDIRFQAKCFNKFAEFKGRGVTILYVGHDISLMRTFCDTCLWLHDGRVVDIGEPVYVSSQYTEFMYLDDDGDMQTPNRQPDIAADAVDAADDTAPDGLHESAFERARHEGRPLAHWGSHVGMIRQVRLTDESGASIGHFTPDDTVIVSFAVEVPNDVETAHLSLAFSMKNREGIDLVVKTTHDEGVSLAGRRDISIAFTLAPRLNRGEYYLVLAAENREHPVTSYYEYLEGALYFKVYHDEAVSGLFLPPAVIEVKGSADE